MESKYFFKKIKLATFHLYYNLFYNYNRSRICSFIYALMNFFQLFSINLNERVKFIFLIIRIQSFGMIHPNYLNILLIL